MSDNELVKLGRVTVTVEFEGLKKSPIGNGLDSIIRNAMQGIGGAIPKPKGKYIDPQCKETEEKRNTSFKTSEKPSED